MKSTIAWALVLAAAAGARAQEPAAAADPQEATITAIQGTVDVKRPADADWVAAEQGMKLAKGSEICTAVASGATLSFPGNITVQVQALTQARVEELLKQGADVKADVNLKFGAVEVDIQKGDLRADMKVTAPNSTTSVSGSHGTVRAPAAAQWPRTFVTLRTFSGTWSHHVQDLDMDVPVQGTAVVNNLAELPRDMVYRAQTHQFMNFFGRSTSELYQDPFTIKGGDVNPGLMPIYELGSSTYFPASDAFQMSATLPLPPPPPPSPQ